MRALRDACADVVADIAEVRVLICALVVGVHPLETSLPLDLPIVRGEEVACEPLVDDAGLLLGPEPGLLACARIRRTATTPE